MNEPKIEGAPGRHFGISEKFGLFPPAPLLQAMDEPLPPGSTIRFITPRGDRLLTFLREHGRLVKQGFLRKHWELAHAAPGGVLSSLAKLSAEHEITRLAVWFVAFDASNTCLLEMEGGNTYIWLAKEFDDAARVRLVEAAGGGVWPTEL